jgi:hypothetical protein
MRHRRLLNSNGASSHIVPRAAVSTASLPSTSFVITLVSGIFGFVLSTCTLLFIWYSYVDFALDMNMGSAQQSQSDVVPHWEWHRYSDFIAEDNVTRIKEATPRYLIVQIVTAEDRCIIDITSKVNRAYAKKWKVDHVKITSFDAANDEYGTIRSKEYIDIIRGIIKIGQRHTASATSSATKSATNKLLQRPYDMVWIFHNPSMMPVDFEKSIFENNDFLVTSIAQHLADNNEQDLITGALLWNLTHPYISKLLDSWERIGSLQEALSGRSQRPLLNRILDDTNTMYHSPGESIGITAEQTNFEGHTKNMIKLQSVADLVCFRYFPACDVL